MYTLQLQFFPPPFLLFFYKYAKVGIFLWHYLSSHHFEKYWYNDNYKNTYPLLGIYPETTTTRKDTCTPMFIVALFAITKTGKQSKCLWTEERIKRRCTYTQWNITQPLKWSTGIFSNMDGPTNYHAKWSQPYNQTPTSNAFTDMWNLKKGQNRCWLTDTEKLNGLQRRQFGGWVDVLGLWDGNPVKSDCYDHYTTTDVINSFE